jgi:hypothetical protein
MPSPGQTKRISRIRRRAIPAVREAYERGDISAKRADTLLYLPADQQVAELERRLSEAHEREARHRLVSESIRGYLDGLNGRRVDLNELAQRIREALAFAKS